jgi:hypothetical protein
MIAITPQTTGIPTSPLSDILPRAPTAQAQPAPQAASPAPTRPSSGRLLDVTT